MTVDELRHVSLADVMKQISNASRPAHDDVVSLRTLAFYPIGLRTSLIDALVCGTQIASGCAAAPSTVIHPRLRKTNVIRAELPELIAPALTSSVDHSRASSSAGSTCRSFRWSSISSGCCLSALATGPEPTRRTVAQRRTMLMMGWPESASCILCTLRTHFVSSDSIALSDH